MPIPKETPFQAYSFSAEEYEQVPFSPVQEMWIRNELATAAMAKLAASAKPVDERDPKGNYLRIQSYYEGQIEILQYILGASDGIKSGMITEIMAKRAQEEALKRAGLFGEDPATTTEEQGE